MLRRITRLISWGLRQKFRRSEEFRDFQPLVPIFSGIPVTYRVMMMIYTSVTLYIYDKVPKDHTSGVRSTKTLPKTRGPS